MHTIWIKPIREKLHFEPFMTHDPFAPRALYLIARHLGAGGFIATVWKHGSTVTDTGVYYPT